MAEIFKLYKSLGETPLECIERFRAGNPEYVRVKMTYLGRLDPMAEGLLLVLADNTRDKERYLAWDKTYEFEVLWGVSTDTYDVLGKVTRAESNLLALNPLFGGSDATPKLDSTLRRIKNKRTQTYPPFSSRTVGGKPLWELARKEKIEEVDVPTRQIKIFNINHIHTRYITGEEVLKEVERKISLVKGDFRQADIGARWKEVLGERGEEKFLISKCTADVSSGTYIRGLAHEMGELLGMPALAWSIKRTRVGEYKI